MEELKIGNIIKQRYSLVDFLGSGSFGEVWLAHDQMTGRDVALKIYLSLDPAGVEEFQREYSNTADLSSPYLLTPEYFDVHNRRPFLVMKYCANGSSSKLAGQISEDKLWAFIHDVASGLEVLHSQSDPIVHQDIKPDNILVDSNGRFLITDFGISKKLRSTMRRQSKRDVSSGAMPYMAPERFDSSPKLNPASDIWSLGASIYELAIGELPLNGFGGTMLRHGAEIPSLSGNYSKDINNLMQACLSPNPLDRPTADKIAKAAYNRSYHRASSTNGHTDYFAQKATVKESGNISRRIGIIAAIAVLFIVLCFAAYRLGVSGIKDSSAVAVSDTIPNPNTTQSVQLEHVNDSIIASIPEKKEESTDIPTNVPKPQKPLKQSSLPFNPAGCPFVFVKGNDRAAMSSNKSINARIYGRDYTFTIGDNHPNGVRALVIAEGYGDNLFNYLEFSGDDDEAFFDEFDGMNTECNMQLTAMDFNNDNECEILLTLQSEGYVTAKTYIFKLLPHPYRETLVKYLGVAEGQQYMYVDETNIIAPYGSQGLFEEYILATNGRIINIGN